MPLNSPSPWQGICLVLLFAAHAAMAQAPQGETKKGLPPKLIVAITVDQMRADYLTRYNEGFGEDGFRRFYDEGFAAMDHHFSYAPTYTGPGHASIATGTTPAVHGIIGNNWYSRAESRSVYCAEDASTLAVGMPNTDIGSKGQMSPHRMASSTWADELKLHFTQRNGRAPKIIGASMKDRGAILPAGHAANAAYWLVNGDFITSNHYMESLPNWVIEFNESNATEDYINGGWSLMNAPETYQSCMKDNNPYEGKWKNSDRPTLPYDISKLADENGGKDIIKGTPMGNSLLVDFGIQAMREEELGLDGVPDVLALSFSSTDYVGHKFGAHAMETEDTYLRLDADLGRLFDALDDQVGKGQWLAFLTADHGAVTVPGIEKSRGLPVDYWNPEPMKAMVDSALLTRYGRSDLILKYENDQFFLNRPTIHEAQLNAHDMARFVAHVAEQFEEVQRTLTAQDLRSSSFSEGAEANVQRGWHAKASGDIVVMLKPGFLEYSRTGTSHGSPYAYDTHVPFLIMGPGIPKDQRSYRRTAIRDIAPTLSALLGFPRPSATTGQPMLDLFDE